VRSVGIRDLECGVGAEDRHRVAAGCGQDRSGADDPQPADAAAGRHQRAAGVPYGRQAVAQDRVTGRAVEVDVRAQVDELGQQRSPDLDEPPEAAQVAGGPTATTRSPAAATACRSWS
jgi:hypothetical protein